MDQVAQSFSKNVKAKDARDTIIVSVVAGFLFIDLAFLIYIFFNRNYLPLKTKNIPLLYILFAYIAVLCWYVGAIYSNHYTLVYHSRALCIVMNKWFYVGLGLITFNCIHIFRLYQYILIFIYKRSARGWYMWGPAGALIILVLAFGIFASVAPPSIGVVYIPSDSKCMTNKPVYFAALAVFMIVIIAAIYLTIMARKVMSCFNEFREMIVITVLLLVCAIVEVATSWVDVDGKDSFLLRAVSTLVQFAVVQAYFVILFGVPTYYSIFNREEYLKRFLRKLKANSLTREYEMVNDQSVGNIRSSSAPLYTPPQHIVKIGRITTSDNFNQFGASYQINNAIYDYDDDFIIEQGPTLI